MDQNGLNQEIRKPCDMGENTIKALALEWSVPQVDIK
jgi:hypothetical protein